MSDSQPQRGPKDALVTIVEWCDLRGDACRAADKAMNELMSGYAGRLRWVHRHLIDPGHFAESHLIHAFARGAFQHGDPDNPEKFWQARAKLLALPAGVPSEEVALRRIAQEIDVDYEAIHKGILNKEYAGGLAIDTSFAGRFGVKESPGFFVNGRRVRAVESSKLKAEIAVLIDEELANAQKLVEGGVAQASVYEELTKDGLWMVNEDRSKRPKPRELSQSLSSAKPN